MEDSLVILGWVALGLAVSFVAMVHPFRRGPSGVILNIVVAVGGALLGGLLGRTFGVYDRFSAPSSFGFAVLTAAAATAAMHVVLVRRGKRLMETPAE